MNANELVITARLADRYEDAGIGDDSLEVAKHDFGKFKRDAPGLWRVLYDSNLSDRKIGDWLYDFLVRWSKSGMSLKNFALDEMDRRA